MAITTNTTKIFGIGLSRTGTTSLTAALEILGYRAYHFPHLKKGLFGKFSIHQFYLENYQVLTDTPVAFFYKKLDRKYPKSKFIFTTRELDSWLSSCARYPAFTIGGQGSKSHPASTNLLTLKLRMKIYDTLYFEESKFKKAYLRHYDDVTTYFRSREEDLLIIDITRGEGWEKLCKFLNKEIPTVPFPKKNQRLN